MFLLSQQRHHPQRQRGAFGLLAIGVLLLLVVCMVVALDTGRLYMQKQNVQRVADLAALDAIAGLSFSGGEAAGNAQTLAEQNASLNNFSHEPTERWVETTMGTIRLEDGIYRFDESPGSALRVEAYHRVPTSLVGNLARLMPNSGISSHVLLKGEAVAQQREYVAFTAGSSLLTADLSSSPLLGPILQQLLGSEVDIDLVSFEGLADIGVSLLSLVEAHPSIGTLDELLSTPLAIGGTNGLANLMIQALGSDAKNNEILALNELVNVALAPIQLADILVVNTPDASRESALETLVSAGGLLNAGVFLANKGESAVSLRGVEVNVGNLVNVDLDLGIIEPPQLAIGPPGCAGGSSPPCNSPDEDGNYWATQAATAQLDLELKLSLELLGLLSLKVDLEIAGATGTAGVEAIKPADGGVFEVAMAGIPGLIDLNLGAQLGLLNDFLSLSSGGDGGSSNEGLSGGYSSGAVMWPGADAKVVLGNTGSESVSNSLNNVLSNLNPTVEVECGIPLIDIVCWLVVDPVLKLLGVTVNGLTDGVRSLLGGLVGDALGPLLLDPLLSALGIGAAEIEVEIIDVGTSGAELVQ